MKERKRSSNNKKRFHLCGAALFLCLAIVGCKKKEDKLGLGIYPEEDQLGLINTDTFTIVASTVMMDSVLSDDLPYALLGSYVDPEFGQSMSSVSVQFQPSTTTVDFGNISTLVIDSVDLSLVYLGYYGIQSLHQFTVNELSEDIYKDSVYFSNRVFQTTPENILFQSVYSPDYTGKNISVGEEPEQLKLKLDLDFGKRLIEQANISTDGTDFVELFKGINISAASAFTAVQPQGNGAIWSFDLASDYSKITVYYHNDTVTSTYDFGFSDELTKVNHFTHDYSGTLVESALNSTTTGEAILYMQGMAGVAINFEVPYLEGLVDNGPVSINKAELVFTVEEGSTDTYVAEYDYFLAVLTDAGSYTVTVDEVDGDLSVGGELNLENEYRFIINRDIQYLVNNFIEGNDYNFGYRLMNVSGGVQFARTILKGTKAGNGEVKLIVSFTPI
ncbi:MAG: DUF4270 domain-containing protein [Flavobacteriales bacterium]|nr:DUF4270 domain-containing protein [Flavobacteriales bacterium]